HVDCGDWVTAEHDQSGCDRRRVQKGADRLWLMSFQFAKACLRKKLKSMRQLPQERRVSNGEETGENERLLRRQTRKAEVACFGRRQNGLAGHQEVRSKNIRGDFFRTFAKSGSVAFKVFIDLS